MNLNQIHTILAHARPVEHKPLLIYIHIPFCSSKCAFCDWVVDIPAGQLTSGGDTRSRYVNALRTQIGAYGPLLTQSSYRPKFLYWGGGTPTRLSSAEIADIVKNVERSFDLSGLQQHTMESSPETLDDEKLSVLRDLGVTRLSIGIQSFENGHLKVAGRAHSSAQAFEAVRRAKRAGFTDLNIDLISGFPDEELEAFSRSLDRAVSLEPSHISIYSYRATPKTVFAMKAARGTVKPLSLNSMIASYEHAKQKLSRVGYNEYCYGYFAASADRQFSAGLYQYGLGGEMIGFGSGARSVVARHAMRNDDDDFDDYLEKPTDFEDCEPFSLHNPRMFTDLIGGALMTSKGIDFDDFFNITGFGFESVATIPHVRAWFRYLQNCGLKLQCTDKYWRADPDSKHVVYLTHLYHSMHPSLRHVELTVQGQSA